MRRPTPAAMRIIEKFLFDKKMRLLDLFQFSDAPKNWKVSRQDLKDALRKVICHNSAYFDHVMFVLVLLQHGVPISDVLLEDLVLSLDEDLTDELDYRELAKGMELWKMEKRDKRRHEMASLSFSSSPCKLSPQFQLKPFLY